MTDNMNYVDDKDRERISILFLKKYATVEEIAIIFDLSYGEVNKLIKPLRDSIRRSTLTWDDVSFDYYKRLLDRTVPL